jgi:hypothetical protein
MAEFQTYVHKTEVEILHLFIHVSKFKHVL